jgi:predicted acyltransferase
VESFINKLIEPDVSTTLSNRCLAGKRPRYNAAVIGLTGLGCLLAGLALSPFIPVIMKLWTASYGLMSAGWACLLFLAFYWTIDVLGHRGWALFLVVIGVNALAAYLGPTLVQTHRMTNPFLKPLVPQLGDFGPVLSTAAVLLVNWLLLFWLYRRKIFLRP